MLRSADLAVFFRLLAELGRVVLGDGHDDLAAGGGEFELRDQFAGAVPHSHLPV